MTEERKNWTKDETIVAFNLYCKIPFGKITKTNPEIIHLATTISRTPSAVNMKIGNLARLDPELKKRGVTGLPNGSRMDEEVWNEFNGNWDNLAFESEKILARLQNINLEHTLNRTPGIDALSLPDGVDKQRLVKTRVNQSFFRSTLLAVYNYRCCITGLPVPELLVASHIEPWVKNISLRTDPHNGLLLNCAHDKAFDEGLITVTTDYKIKVSKRIKEYLPETTIKEMFINYDGGSIILPERFLPSKVSLEWHNINVFKG